jgi:hypothetical protein
MSAAAVGPVGLGATRWRCPASPRGPPPSGVRRHERRFRGPRSSGRRARSAPGSAARGRPRGGRRRRRAPAPSQSPAHPATTPLLQRPVQDVLFGRVVGAERKALILVHDRLKERPEDGRRDRLPAEGAGVDKQLPHPGVEGRRTQTLLKKEIDQLDRVAREHEAAARIGKSSTAARPSASGPSP